MQVGANAGLINVCKGVMHPAMCYSGMEAGAAPQAGWETGFVADFSRRYMQLLSYEFRSFDPTLALTVLDAGACSALNV